MQTLLSCLLLMTTLSAVTVEQLFNIKTVEVKRQTVENQQQYNGYVQIADDHISTITLTQDGFVRQLRFPNLYDNIVKGEKLFEFYSPEIYKAQIELLSAKEVSASLAKQIETKLRLYDLSTQTINQIKRRGHAMKYLPFYAPRSGLVIESKINEGTAVKKGMELYKIADLSELWIVAKAYEQDRAMIQKGKRVEVSFAGIRRHYVATIDLVYPLVDRINKTIDFRIRLDNRDGAIQPNAYATISMITTSKSMLTLPKTAVVTKGKKHLVFVPSMYEGEYKSKRIEAKRIGASQFEIISGLKEGDRVVNHSLFLLDSDVLINGEE